MRVDEWVHHFIPIPTHPQPQTKPTNQTAVGTAATGTTAARPRAAAAMAAAGATAVPPHGGRAAGCGRSSRFVVLFCWVECWDGVCCVFGGVRDPLCVPGLVGRGGGRHQSAHASIRFFHTHIHQRMITNTGDRDGPPALGVVAGPQGPHAQSRCVQIAYKRGRGSSSGCDVFRRSH